MNEINEQGLPVKPKAELLREIERLNSELMRLERELGDAKKELAEERSEVVRKEAEETASLKNELAGLTAQYDDAKKKIVQLDAQLDSANTSLKKQSEELRILREKLLLQTQDYNNKISKSEQTIHELKKQVVELEKSAAQTASSDVQLNGETESVQFKDSKSTFLIDLYPDQEGYRGKITHTLSNTKQKLAKIDGTQIIKFIQKFLPQALDNGVSENYRTAELKNETSRHNDQELSLLSFKFPSGTIKAISFKQPDMLPMRNRLKAGEPIDLIIDCLLPSAVDTALVSGNPINFYITIKDLETYNRLIDKKIEEMIKVNEYRYLSHLHLDQLAQGSFLLDVYLHAPNCGISEYKSCTLTVIS